MKRTCALTSILFGFAVTAWSPLGAAQERQTDTRFYLTPMGTYGFFDDDRGNDLDADDGGGFHLSFGKVLNKHLALEIYGTYFPEIDLEATTTGEIETYGYGISALLFPNINKLPFFGVLGIGRGEYDFELTGIPDIEGEHDSDFYDVGVGFLLPLADIGINDRYGFSIRGEYRYRAVEVDTSGGDTDFDNHILSLGLQIPLGPNPNAPKPAPAPAPPPPAPLDSDGDGVLDRNDQCPGTAAGVQVDVNGCPLEKDEPIVLKGVTFEYNSAKLTAEAENRLDNVVSALRAERGTSVRIEGHTDSIGSASYNLDLSQRRADSVKAYLIEHGIDANRLATQGYGETRPVAPNTKPNGADNPAGRAQNRRVELDVVDQ